MTKKNKLRLFPSLWAILETELTKIEALYESLTPEMIADYEKQAHEAFGPGFDIPQGGLSPDVTIIDNVGVLRVEGVITQKSSFFSMIFGGATLDSLARDFKMLADNEQIDTIVLDMDSPGGSVFGVQEFANLVFDAREHKKIIAISSSVMTSAAMWIGAAAEDVFVSGGTVVTGSIGVLTTHVDISQMQADLGIKTTEITAGREKRIASSFAPLTDAGRSSLQMQVEKIMDAFVLDIAKFRGASEQEVRSNMADGKTFIGDDAIKAGLVDDIKTFDLLIETISNGGNEMALFTKKEANLENLRADHSGLYQEAVAVGVEQGKAKLADDAAQLQKSAHIAGVSSGAEAERARIEGINKATIPGHEALAKTLIADGNTSPGDAALAMIEANRTSHADGLKKIKDTSAKAIEDETGEATIKDVKSMTAREQWDADAKLAKEFDSFEAFEAVTKNSDNYRILKK